MSASLIRSRAMVTHAIDRHRWNEITDGAVLQEDGAVVEIGTYRDLSRRHPNVAVIGSGNEVMLPGFVNGHHHIGLTPVQLGSPDMPLELWFVTRMVMRNVNLYLDTLYSAFEMVASGVTTVQHLHGRIPGKLDQVDRGSDEVIRAYQNVGMRVSFSYAVRDQNRLVYQQDEDFIASLPSELRGPMQRWFERFQLTLDDDIALFEGLYGRYRDARRVKVQLAPANLHYRYDPSYALEVYAKYPERFRVVKPIDPADPAVDDVLADWAKTKGAVGVRRCCGKSRFPILPTRASTGRSPPPGDMACRSISCAGGAWMTAPRRCGETRTPHCHRPSRSVATKRAAAPGGAVGRSAEAARAGGLPECPGQDQRRLHSLSRSLSL